VGTPVTSFGLSAISCTRSSRLHHQGVHALEALLHARALFADIEDLLLGLVQDGGRPACPCGLKALVAISSLALTSLRRMARSRTISA
jgi:hypothetical protein